MRHFAIALLVFASAAVAAQDEARVRELIRQLDAEEFSLRDEAFEALVKIGAPALPLLREAAEKDDSGEVRVRAGEAVKAIELNEAARHVYSEPKLVTLSHQGSLRDALAKVAEQAGVEIRVADAAVDAEVNVTFQDAPLFRVLDELCRGRADCTWEHPEKGVIRMLREKHATAPADYAGPFRVRLSELVVERKTDFKEATAVVRFALDADHQKYLKPFLRPTLEATKIVDDQGREVPVVRGTGNEANGGMLGGAAIRIVGIPGMGGGDDADRRFSAPKLPADARKIASLRGTAVWKFPLEHKDLVFDNPMKGDVRDAGDWRTTIKAKVRDGFTVSFERKTNNAEGPGPFEEIEQRFDRDSVVLLLDDGREVAASSVAGQNDGMNIVVINGVVQRGGAVTYKFTFDDFKSLAVKSLKFRFVEKTLDKKIEFELKDIELP